LHHQLKFLILPRLPHVNFHKKSGALETQLTRLDGWCSRG
jgi:hypothetical protein